MHRGFYCVVFDFCDCTLGDILENQVDLLPLPARHVMEIGFQLVKAIECRLFFLCNVVCAQISDYRPPLIRHSAHGLESGQCRSPLLGVHNRSVVGSTDWLQGEGALRFSIVNLVR